MIYEQSDDVLDRRNFHKSEDMYLFCQVFRKIKKASIYASWKDFIQG